MFFLWGGGRGLMRILLELAMQERSLHFLGGIVVVVALLSFSK